jgi:hypothetical protein
MIISQKSINNNELALGPISLLFLTGVKKALVVHLDKVKTLLSYAVEGSSHCPSCTRLKGF